MSKGFFIDGKGTPVYWGARHNKPILEADHEWVPSSDSRSSSLHDAMKAMRDEQTRPDPDSVPMSDLFRALKRKGVLTDADLEAS